jgi:hypothetical protein
MENQKVFADGFIFKRNDAAPQFVIGNISVKVDEAVQFLTANQKNGWVNLGIKQSQGGKYYIELDTFEPKRTESSAPAPAPAPTPAPAPEQQVPHQADLPF